MPVYWWKGLDAQGLAHQGTQCAISVEALRDHLLERGIGLLEARTAFISPRISHAQQEQFLGHLARLIQAHIPLHSALIIIASTIKQRSFKAIIEDVASLIAQGQSLSDALQFHGLADELTKAVMEVSEKTGALGPALQSLADHRAFINALRKKMRSSLLNPVLTFIFFLLIMLCIFLCVIPQLESYFLSYKAPLPAITAAVLALSRFFRSTQALWMLASSLIATAIMVKVARMSWGRHIRDKLCLLLPGITGWVRLTYQARILKMVGMLLEQGVPLSQAFDVCIQTVEQHIIRRSLVTMKCSIEAGSSLLAAWRESLLGGSPDIEAFLTMGESTGDLGAMTTHAADACLTRIYDSLHVIVTLVQPLVLFFLGILVACLLVAVYMPLLTLSELLV